MNFTVFVKNFFSPELNRMTASDYSRINGREGEIGKRNCILYVMIQKIKHTSLSKTCFLYSFKHFSTLKIAMTKWFLAETFFCQIFFCYCFVSQTVFVYNVVHTSHQARYWHFFIVEIIFKVRIWYRHKNITEKQSPWWRATVNIF